VPPDDDCWRSVTLEMAPLADITQTARDPCCAKDIIFVATSSPAAIVNMCGVKFWPAEPASTTPIWANNAAAQEQCQHPNIDKKPSID
jgi:hypothetical protein